MLRRIHEPLNPYAQKVALMSSGPDTHIDRDPQKGPINPSPHTNKIALATALVLLVGGLLFFTHTQTQPLFQDAHDLDALNVQNPRNDVGLLVGGLMAASGLTLFLAIASPLRPSDRFLPAALLTVTTALLLTAHFSIFTNGMTFPDQRGLAVKSSFLFHDTAATIPMATFTLAWLTLLVLVFAGLAAMALITPGLLKDHFTRPRTLQAQRARLFAVTLLLLAAGSTFARQYLAFARIDSPLEWVYILMGMLLIILVLSIALRTYRVLWGPLEHRISKRCVRRHRNWVRFESSLWGLLLLSTILTLFRDPVYEPVPGTDPVFAISSKGLSLVLFVVFGVYLLQRRFTKAYPIFLAHLERPLPTMKPDRLLAVGAMAITAWSAGALWALHPDLTPLEALVLRLLPLVLLIPILTLRHKNGPSTSPTERSWNPMMIFAWTTMSVLTGIMLWGIGNSTTIIFQQSSGGLLSEPGHLLESLSVGTRLLGSLLITAPLLLTLRLLVVRRKESVSSGLLVLTGLMLVLALTVLFTLEPSTHHSRTLAHTDVIVGFWTSSLPTGFDVAIMSTVVGLTAALGLLISFTTLRKGVEVPLPRDPVSPWWTRLFERVNATLDRTPWKPRWSSKAPHGTTPRVPHHEE